jgi:hypothetical protein
VHGSKAVKRVMLQSEVQAVTITKTIRKGKRLLPGQSYLSNPTDSIMFA